MEPKKIEQNYRNLKKKKKKKKKKNVYVKAVKLDINFVFSVT